MRRYMTVDETGEEMWYDSYREAIAAAGDNLCIVAYTYELITQEFVHHAIDHDSDECER